MRQCRWLMIAILLCAYASGVRADVLPQPDVDPAAVPIAAPSAPEQTPSDGDAEDDEPSALPTRHYSDGPRDVPTPSGAAKRLAARLGLGRRETGSNLITRAPEASWVRASRGRRTRTLLWPVVGGRWGRGHGFTRRERRELKHEGVDISAPTGTQIRAAADGIVAYSDNGLHGYGNCVILVHSNGWVTLYAHMKKTIVQPGQVLRRGARLGLVGATGIARGPHLHFELRERGDSRDPLPLFVNAPAEVARMQRASGPGRRRRTSAR